MGKKKWVVLLALALAGISIGWGTDQDRRQSTRTGDSKSGITARDARLESVKLQRNIPAMRRAAAARFKQLRSRALAAKTSPFGKAVKAEAMAMPMPDPGGIPHYFGPSPNYANSPLPAGPIAGVTLVSGGSGYIAPEVMIEDLYGTGTGASATAALGPGGVITGITLLNAGSGYSAPMVHIIDTVGAGADAAAAIGGPFAGGLRKFVDGLPGLNQAGANNLGQYIPVAIPDTTTYAGSDYYEIELGQYMERLHSDLGPTMLRGYRQTNTSDASVSAFHYLGPLIVARRDRPVRVKFTNNLPTGAGGNLFIPVDTTMMGAGMGPTGAMYTENRATIHLHGAFVPWISDGTPHQWTTPVTEGAAYPTGVSVYNVPDMPNPGANPPAGELTFYYNNQQSARLMFYHDHAFGITRLNVYAGEAAGYVLTDAVEDDLINGTNVTGVNPGLAKLLPDVGIPLIIQDKTFVDAATIYAQDPTWNWGSMPGMPMTGDLWMPHVYMPNQNPADLSGMNAFGRWHYGPWFWPPTTGIANGPVPNPYYDPINAPWEAPEIPDTPNPSMAMEAFMDTPLVNGTVYPYMEVEPKAYRLRVLNVCNDRFVNLQLYHADPSAITADGRTNTEVRMVPAVQTPGFPQGWPTDGREGGVPDPALAGPDFIQIGTEGGFLPAPVVVPNQPVDWNLNPTTFNFGNVSSHALLLGPAERADVLVDFSAYAGQTLILYNDAPAAFPALDPRYDYYTGNPDQTSSGGTPPTQPGYGPNTRTIMQIRVAGAASAPFAANLAGLQQAFAKTPDKRGVFEVSQDPILVPQAAYNSAYNGNFPADPYIRIFEASKTFQTLDGSTLTLPLQPKAIQDEMGEAFDTEYGRMSGFLGVQLPAQAGQQQFTLFPFASPPVEIIGASMTPMSPVAGDGTQLWKVTHNGVDTHTLHFHLFNVQLINRVAWDNGVSEPDANELGWKETVRVNPLEDTIVALRPVAPTQPFDIPNSVRPIDVTMPLGEILNGGPFGFKDPQGNPVTVVNHEVNFGWEYVLHCHLLGHEEMDMMHGMAIVIPPNAPTGLSGVRSGGGNSVDLTWTDNSLGETGFTIQRSADADFAVQLTEISLGANVTAFTDTGLNQSSTYFYRVIANNLVGDNGTPGFPLMNADSAPSNVINFGPVPPPAAPTSLSAVLQAGPSVLLQWSDNSLSESGFVIERADNGGAFAVIATPGPGVDTGVLSYADSTVVAGGNYIYQVQAVNGALASPYSNTASISVPNTVTPPAAPTNLRAAVRRGPSVLLRWLDNATDETGFVVERSNDGGVVFLPLVTLPASNGTGLTSYTDTDVALGGTFYYRVRAVNSGVSSAYSNVVNAAVPSPIPTAPANVSAVAVRWNRTSDRVRLTWADLATNETGYTVQFSTDSTFATGVTAVNLRVNSTDYRTDNLPRNVRYYFRVRAFNAAYTSAWVNAAPFPVITP